MPREHAASKTGGETLDLTFDGLRHIHRVETRDVAVGPRDVAASRRTSRVAYSGLRQNDERARGRLATRDIALGGGNLLERPAEMNGRRMATGLRHPGNRPVEGVVDLEHAWTVWK